MSVCMYICTHVCMYVCMYVCTHACMHACMHGWMDGWMYVCMYVYLYIHIYIYTYTHMHIYIYRWICIIVQGTADSLVEGLPTRPPCGCGSDPGSKQGAYNALFVVAGVFFWPLQNKRCMNLNLPRERRLNQRLTQSVIGDLAS